MKNRSPRIGEKAWIVARDRLLGRDPGSYSTVLGRRSASFPERDDLFSYVLERNRDRINGIVGKIRNALGEIKNARVGILGLTYKPGTSTLRRSLPLEIAGRLVQEGARVSAYDPKADYEELGSPPAFHVAKSIAETAKDADMLVLLTEWEDFRQFDWSSIIDEMKRPIFLDTKNCLDEDRMKKMGFRHISLGRGLG